MKDKNGASMLSIGFAIALAIGGSYLTLNGVFEIVGTGGASVKAYLITGIATLAIFSLGLTLFFQGISASNDDDNGRRMKRLGVVLIGFLMLTPIDTTSNLMGIGIDSGEQAAIQTLVDENQEWVDQHNKLLGDVDGAVLAFQSVQARTEAWLKCERAVGCLSGRGGGTGDTTDQLEEHLNAIISAQTAMMEFSQQHKGLRKAGNAILAEMRYIQDNARFTFQEKLDKLKVQIEAMGAINKRLKNLWPAELFDTLADAYTKDTQTYVAEGIPPQAARSLENYYKPKGDSYYTLAVRLDRAKRSYVPDWGNPTKFELLLSSNELGYMLLISIAMALSMPLLLLFHVLSNPPPTSSAVRAPRIQRFTADDTKEAA